MTVTATCARKTDALIQALNTLQEPITSTDVTNIVQKYGLSKAELIHSEPTEDWFFFQYTSPTSHQKRTIGLEHRWDEKTFKLYTKIPTWILNTTPALSHLP